LAPGLERGYVSRVVQRFRSRSPSRERVRGPVERERERDSNRQRESGGDRARADNWGWERRPCPSQSPDRKVRGEGDERNRGGRDEWGEARRWGDR
jgi:hypothetical protein